MIALDDLPRPAGVAAPSTRLDPYWEGAWRTGSPATWLGAPAVERAVAAGTARLPRGLAPTYTNPYRSVRTFHRRVALTACARMWGSLTIQQAALVTGFAPRDLVRDARALFRAGVLDLGLGMLPGLGQDRIDERTLVSVRPRSQVRAHLATLPPAAYLSATSGMEWVRASATARHNALTAELALRVASHLAPDAVAGEALASTALWLEGTTGKRADALLQLRDDLVVMVETTASPAATLEPKAVAWARELAAHPGSPVVVLFLVAPPADAATPRLGEKVRKAVAAATRTHPGPVSDPVRSRMMVAAWEDWFPSPGTADERYLTLAAQAYRHGAWHWVDLVAHRVPCDRPSHLAENTALLGGLPWWLRDGEVSVAAKVAHDTGISCDSLPPLLVEQAVRPA